MTSYKIELVKKTTKSIAADLKTDERVSFLDWSQLTVEYVDEHRSELNDKELLWVYLIFQEDTLCKGELVPESLWLNLKRTIHDLENKYVWDTFSSPYICRLGVAGGTAHEILKKYIGHWTVIFGFVID